MSVVHTTLPKFLTEPDPEIYRSENYVVVDFETTNIEKGTPLNDDNKLVLAAWWTPTGGMKYKWGGEFEQQELIAACEAADFIVAHNAGFELGWLRRCGLKLEETLVWCTQIADYVIGGNRWQLNKLSLSECASRHGISVEKDDFVSSLIRKAKICPSDIPRRLLLKYCMTDVEVTRWLFASQLDQTDQLPIIYTRCLATPVLTDIEFNGMQLDVDAVQAMYDTKRREFAEAQETLGRMTGGINFRSPVQLAEFLYDELKFAELKDRRGSPLRTAKGGRLTAQDVVLRLPCKNKRQTEFIAQYKLTKALSNEITKYLSKLNACCEEAEGFLQGKFNQTNTQTHRLSSSGLRYKCQFQNFPRAYKKIFKARHDGWFVGEADGAQLEFRAAAQLGRDRVAIDDIVEGTDIHSVTADIIGVTRQDAKAHTFKPLYGGTSGTEAQQRYYKFFAEKYSGITETQKGWINTVLENKFLETEWGMRYYWPDCKMSRSGYVEYTTSICNYPVQAFATAEIIPMALTFFWHYLKRSDYKMLLVNTVHDSVIAEIPPDEVAAFKELSKLSFLDNVALYMKKCYNVDMIVPLATGIKIAERWGATDEEELFTMELQA